MNYIITHRCDKGCSYCFAKEHRNSLIKDNSSEMSLDSFKQYVKKNKHKRIKLLGGEPTSHPQFDKFLEYIFNETDKDLTIISNFLFNQNVLDIILLYLKKFKNSERKMGFLVNCSELNIGTRMEKFKHNYNNIHRLLYKDDLEEHLAIGTTIEKDKDSAYYIEYLDYLTSNIEKIERFRLSLAFPGINSKKDKHMYINDTETGTKIITIMKYLISKAIRPTLDCVVFPCMFDNKEQFKFAKRFRIGLRSKCEGAPTDIFADGSVIYCYPLKDSVKDNIADHKDTNALNYSLVVKYKIIDDKIKKPKVCLKCKYFDNQCKGPCLGLYRQNEIDDLKLGC